MQQGIAPSFPSFTYMPALFTKYLLLLQRIEDFLCILSCDLDIIAADVVLIARTCEIVHSCICSTVGLCDVIVENSTGHGACKDIFQSLCQSIHTYQIDILADDTVFGLDRLQSAECHCVVVAEDYFHIIAVLLRAP